MGIFKSGRRRAVSSAPLPDWDDTRWRSHLRSNALGTDHHCNIYLDMINTDRREAARLFKEEDDAGAERYAESSLRNKRIVAALSSLSPLCNALFQRAEPLVGYTSLLQIPEPARSGIVTIIFAAGRLQLSYLTDTVAFLREQFGPVHIEAIQASEGELAGHVNANVRDALSPLPPEPSQVKAELASAVKEHFNVSISPAASRRLSANHNKEQSSSSLGNVSAGGGGRGLGLQPQQNQPQRYQHQHQQTGVDLSVHSSDLGVPQSPQFSVASSHQQQRHLQLQQQEQYNEHAQSSSSYQTAPSQQQLGGGMLGNTAAGGSSSQQQQRAIRTSARMDDLHQQQQLVQQHQNQGGAMENLDDSDNMLLTRYQDIRAAIAV